MSIKVLVADDSITIQKVIGIIFGGDEYSLTVVDNGKAAVDKAREIIPDILLIDALMPGMSGYEVAEAVRSTPSLAAKPILILTGSFEPFDEEKAKKCGADDFIAKPFESQQIITKVKELLELGNSRAKVTQQTPLPEPESELPIPEEASPVHEIATPEITLQPDALEPSVSADIWAAFTPFVEPAVESTEVPPLDVTPSAEENEPGGFEPDVFAIVSEEDDAQLIQDSVTEHASPQHTGSQWVPVEENTFEFEEEISAGQTQKTFDEQSESTHDSSFGDIAFEDTATVPADQSFAPVSAEFFSPPEPEFTTPAPAFADFVETIETPVAPIMPFEPLSDPVPAFTAPVEPAPHAMAFVAPSVPAATALTEEQLRDALIGASKEVIERIVWEIVPDLADAMIREAIRKIKEGV
jgi:CheY-like chemotaxis protein